MDSRALRGVTIEGIIYWEDVLLVRVDSPALPPCSYSRSKRSMGQFVWSTRYVLFVHVDSRASRI